MGMPVFLVVLYDPNRNAIPLSIGRTSDGARGIAVFTEQLLAERCRDNWQAGARVLQVSDINAWLQFVQLFATSLKVDYVAIDPHELNQGKTAWILCQDILARGADPL